MTPQPWTGRVGSAAPATRFLQIGLAALALLAGADKFQRLIVNWDKYLAPTLTRQLPVSGRTLVQAAGILEIGLAILIVVAPRYGGYALAAWLWLIIVDLLLIPGYFDLALHDAARSFAALALARLSARRPAGE